MAPPALLADRLVSARRAVAALIIAASLSLPAAAQAQRACEARGLDAFASARRARRIVADYRALHMHAADSIALSMMANSLGEWPQPATRYFAVPMIDRMWWPSLTACRDSAPRDASLSALRYGLVAGVQLDALGLMVEGFFLRGGDTMTIAGSASQAEQELSQAQSLFGARARWGRWAEVVVGAIEEDDPDADLEAVPRAYLALGVPALNLQTDLIIDRRDQSLQTLYLDLDRLPLTDAGLALTARAGYLEDERQVVTLAALTVPLWRQQYDTHGMPYSSDYLNDHKHQSVLSVTPELAMEWDGVNLRHARVNARYRAADELLDALRFELEVFADATLFRSHALEARTGESNAFGAAAGGRVALGTALSASLIAESSIAINRPETLAQVSELVGAREYRLQFYIFFPLYFNVEDYQERRAR